MERCIWNGNLIDVNDYLCPFEKAREIRTASDNGELLCIEPNCLCRELVYCHGQIRKPYLRHRDNVGCYYEDFEKRDTPRIKKIRDKLYDLFKSKGYSVKQIVRFPTGRHYAHLLFDSNGKKIVLQIADKSFNKRQCDAIVSECKSSGYLLNWIVIGDTNRYQDDVYNYYISRFVFDTSSDHTLIVINENADVITQTPMAHRRYNNNDFGFCAKGRLEKLVLKDDKFGIDDFDLKYQQWRNQQADRDKKLREESAQNERIYHTYDFNRENDTIERGLSTVSTKLFKGGLKTGAHFDHSNNGRGIITKIEGDIVCVKYANGREDSFFVTQFKSSSLIKILS